MRNMMAAAAVQATCRSKKYQEEWYFTSAITDDADKIMTRPITFNTTTSPHNTTYSGRDCVRVLVVRSERLVSRYQRPQRATNAGGTGEAATTIVLRSRRVVGLYSKRRTLTTEQLGGQRRRCNTYEYRLSGSPVQCPLAPWYCEHTQRPR